MLALAIVLAVWVAWALGAAAFYVFATWLDGYAQRRAFECLPRQPRRDYPI